MLFSFLQRLKKFRQQGQDLDRPIETYRRELIRGAYPLPLPPDSSPSKKHPSLGLQITRLANQPVNQHKYSQLLQFLLTETPGNLILELGTQLGISTRYLSEISCGKVISFEHDELFVSLAKRNFQATNTQFISGPLSERLAAFLSKSNAVDFVLLDASIGFRECKILVEMLLPYLHPKSILALKNIHQSSEDQSLWLELIAFPQFSLSLDFFNCGVLFLDKTLTKKNVVLSY